jgi:hypothetical protein
MRIFLHQWCPVKIVSYQTNCTRWIRCCISTHTLYEIKFPKYMKTVWATNRSPGFVGEVASNLRLTVSPTAKSEKRTGSTTGERRCARYSKTQRHRWGLGPCAVLSIITNSSRAKKESSSHRTEPLLVFPNETSRRSVKPSFTLCDHTTCITVESVTCPAEPSQ